MGDAELKISLPGHCVGTVSITDVSEQYTKALKQIVEEENTDINAGSLKDTFKPGFVLAAAVKETTGNDKGFHKVSLTLKPSEVNGALTQSLVKKGTVMQGAVVSEEDHGFLIDVGVKGARAFLARKKVEKFVEAALGGRTPTVGQILPCLVTKNDGGGAISLTCDPIKLRKAAAQADEDANVHTRLPGKASFTVSYTFSQSHFCNILS